MSKTAVIFFSSTGNTQSMADAILEGAKEVNADTQIFEVPDTAADDVTGFDNLILGCSAMGEEVLEEDSFEPFFADLEKKIEGKNVALFGSYGWGDGEWMRNWEERVKQAKANLIGEGLIAQEEPDDEAVEACKELGKKIAAM